MKNASEILFIIQARLDSERLPKKMTLPFGGSNLFEIAIKKVVNSIVPLSSFYVSVYEQELKEIAKKHNINIYNRSYESAHNDNDLKKIYEWHDKLPFKYVIKLNACSPLLKVETINNFFKTFQEQDGENLFGVIKTKDYYWNKSGKLITPWPKGQTLMNTKAVETTYKAAHVLYASKMDLIKDYKFMGDFNTTGGIRLFEMAERECFDIDFKWQFETANKLYSI
jgi:CMP-N-acetylneuraminic acid synthetase